METDSVSDRQKEASSLYHNERLPAPIFIAASSIRSILPKLRHSSSFHIVVGSASTLLVLGSNSLPTRLLRPLTKMCPLRIVERICGSLHIRRSLFVLCFVVIGRVTLGCKTPSLITKLCSGLGLFPHSQEVPVWSHRYTSTSRPTATYGSSQHIFALFAEHKTRKGICIRAKLQPMTLTLQLLFSRILCFAAAFSLIQTPPKV